MPPAPPSKKPKFGSYCFKATCDVVDESVPGCPVRARVSGYDKELSVGQETEDACNAHARSHRGYRCLGAQIVMLPHSDHDCSGQVYWVMDGKTKQLLG